MSEPRYPFGVIIATVDSMIRVTFLSYVLFLIGTSMGVMFAGSGAGLGMFVVTVFPYILLALFTERGPAMMHCIL